MCGMWRKGNNLPRFLRVCPHVSCVELGVKLNQQALRYAYFTYQSYHIASTRPSQRQTIYLSNEFSSFLIKLTLNELWVAWNLDTFESKRPSVQAIISKIKTRICHRIRAAYNISPGPDFFKSWAHRNILCSYAIQTLTIHI